MVTVYLIKLVYWTIQLTWLMKKSENLYIYIYTSSWNILLICEFQSVLDYF